MKIKESEGGSKLPGRKRVVVFSFLSYSCLLLILGAVAHKNDFTGKIIQPILRVNYRLPYHILKGLLSHPEKLYIDIKYEDFQRLAYFREIALRKGRIITTEDSYVPATVRVGTKAVKADIRLKGDLTDHIRDDKWSLRVKVEGDESILGMKRFSIQDPERSGYLLEWVIYELYKHESLIALRYRYVDVAINGKKMGIYALEESFSNELIEHNGRREGPIIKFDESQIYDPNSSFNHATRKTVTDILTDIFFNSEIDVFRSKKTTSDSSLYLNYLIAKNLLEEFRSGKITASQAFDIEQVAKLYAITNLVNSGHAIRWKNIRFYYNPIISKLELIAYNAYSSSHYSIGKLENLIWRSNYPTRFFVDRYHDRFFDDDKFVDIYLKTLNRISKKEYLDNFFQSIDSELRKNLAIIHRDSPTYTFPKQAYYQNQDMLSSAVPILAEKRGRIN